ncbi:MAG: hypothetical protein EKK39_13360 [Sphingobacteriales bacterium]|nr:MAG: hypothetical protein EKK39_13360 [Sphingobacteriales bacterium]
MNNSSAFPNWFNNILIGIGVYYLGYIVSNYFAKHIPIIVLCYPIVLYFNMYSEKKPENLMDENWWNTNRATHFTNISLSIIGFLTLIQLVKYEYYIDHAGKLIIGIHEIFFTNNYYIKIVIYIFTLLYFIIVGVYLTFKTARRMKYFDGMGAFEAGEKIWRDVILRENIDEKLGHLDYREYREKQMKIALELLDKAIEMGYDRADVFSIRGRCLHDLGFYFDAIEDYNKAIEKKAPKEYMPMGYANDYFMRSLIKMNVFDYVGSLTDIEEAIRLSKLDNDDNKYWNDHTKRTLGFNTATEYYEIQKEFIERRLEMSKKFPEDNTAELEKIKRR